MQVRIVGFGRRSFRGLPHINRKIENINRLANVLYTGEGRRVAGSSVLIPFQVTSRMDVTMFAYEEYSNINLGKPEASLPANQWHNSS